VRQAARASLSSIFHLGCSTEGTRRNFATIAVPQLRCRRRPYDERGTLWRPRNLAELLLLANRCREECMVVVASIFHWRLFRRRGADVQHSATLTQRNSRYGL